MKKLLLSLMMLALAVSVFASPAAESESGSEAPAKVSTQIWDRGNVPAENGTPTDNVWTRWVQEQMLAEHNIELTFIGIQTGGGYRDKINALMAAGDAPDIITTYYDDMVSNYVGQGGLADLTDAVDNYGSNLVKLVGADVMKKYGQFNGKQYMVPGKQAFVGIFADYIRKDWLDALGIAMPTTVDEWYSAIKKIKEEDPGNVGSENIIGFWLDQATHYRLGSTYASNFIYSFVEDMTEEQWYTLPDLGKPGYKEGVRFLNKLYSEGLINPEFALETTHDNFRKAMANGYIVTASAAYWELFGGDAVTALLETTPDAFYEGANIFQNSKGKYVREVRTPVGMRIIVPSFSESVDEAIKYLDWLSIEENHNYLWHGTEGLHHTVGADGTKVMNAKDERGNAEWPWVNSWDISNINRNAYYDFSTPAASLVSLNAMVSGLRAAGKEEQADMQLTGIRVSFDDGFVPPYFPNPIETAGRFGSVLIEKHEETIIKSIMADPADFDSVYDGLYDEYMNAGGNQVVEEKSAAYKAMN